jgi:hypothetical protein
MTTGPLATCNRAFARIAATTQSVQMPLYVDPLRDFTLVASWGCTHSALAPRKNASRVIRQAPLSGARDAACGRRVRSPLRHSLMPRNSNTAGTRSDLEFKQIAGPRSPMRCL